jgi:hypothetical protein
MKKTTLKFTGIILLLNLVAIAWISAQQVAQLLPAESSVTIKGTSNLHDWEENVKKFNVNAAFIFQNNKITGIDKLIFSCKSAALNSESSIMTGKTHDALKSDQHPDIKFTLTKVDQVQQNGSALSGSVTGDLLIAGVVRTVSLPFKGTLASNQLLVKGSKELKMTDFKITPPTAVFGTLKTDETIELIYSLKFQLN